jgi:hypothetical protein
MKCPICEIDLAMTDRQGIEIDYCPKCRGIWLDRGELDKIIEKNQIVEKPEIPSVRGLSNIFGARDDNYSHDEHGHGDYSRGHKKKGMLGELFDF